MANPFKEIRDDFSFIKSHTLQPQWYKILKVFLILGYLGAHLFFYGARKTLIFYIKFSCSYVISNKNEEIHE